MTQERMRSWAKGTKLTFRNYEMLGNKDFDWKPEEQYPMLWNEGCPSHPQIHMLKP